MTETRQRPAVRTTVLDKEQVRTLQLAAEGFTHQEIARKLGVSAIAVHDRLHMCRRKLGDCNNTTQAVAVAMRQGIIR